MIKLLSLSLVLWILLFCLRILQIGGLDLTYIDKPTEILKPLQVYLSQIINQILPFPQSSILAGMLIGSKENLPYYLKTKLQITSTIHLIVVSGQNLSLLAGFVMSLTAYLGRKKTILLTTCIILFYSIITGLQVPVLRAAIMAILSYLGQILGKEKTGWWILAFTAGAMLLYNPNWLLSISFQLSFMATLAVVVVGPILVKCLHKVPNILREDLAVTLGAQALTLPIIALNFNQLSLVGVVVNTLVLWTVPVVMITGFISLGLGIINTFLGQITGLIPSILITYFLNIVDLFSNIPGANIKLVATTIMLWLGYYLIVGAIIWWLHLKLKFSK